MLLSYCLSSPDQEGGHARARVMVETWALREDPPSRYSGLQ